VGKTDAIDPQRSADIRGQLGLLRGKVDGTSVTATEMGRSILAPFDTFQAEAAIIGKVLAGYTTLEVGLMHCVQVVRDDFDAVLKAMFRARGETQRIDVADALGRYFYHDRGLGTEFEMAVGSVRYCLKIRNQYAHCVWYDDKSGKLAFVNLEEIAKRNDRLPDLTSLTVLHVDAPLLIDQEAYFVYADALLAWTNYEGRLRDGKIRSNPLQKPSPMKQPPMNIPYVARKALDRSSTIGRCQVPSFNACSQPFVRRAAGRRKSNRDALRPDPFSQPRKAARSPSGRSVAEQPAFGLDRTSRAPWHSALLRRRNVWPAQLALSCNSCSAPSSRTPLCGSGGCPTQALASPVRSERSA
jgi:hypothetical protein